jgi:glutathione S-transferase
MRKLSWIASYMAMLLALASAAHAGFGFIRADRAVLATPEAARLFQHTFPGPRPPRPKEMPPVKRVWARCTTRRSISSRRRRRRANAGI